MQTFNHNSIERFLFDNHGVRGEITRLKTPFEDLIHDDYPDCLKKIMMELAVSSVLVASTLKDGSEIMVQIRGGKDAPLKYALINIRQDLSFYGSCALKDNCAVDNNASIHDLCGQDGILALSVFPQNGVKWQGIVALNNESIGATLEDYFKNSQQLPTRFFISTDLQERQSGGIMLQIIPEVEGNIESLEHLSVLSATLSAKELFTLPLDESLGRLFAHEETKVFGEKEVLFKCICSKSRCENALMQLDPAELKNMAEDPKGTSMTCQHCGKTYTFTQEELASMYRKISQ
ncbi:Hsp33 family molecular chaperone HslO [Succinivibrio dextrinosolvens]|uniref:Molecular chaperone Hsp33 n=1 Tax=Succinivibrio dextrinosolvens TaxID=83771 RepID=A0A662Z6E4_9GAMM|nr:Hsp33 family molecular chaperone HslO [Succinivibrio dextrinosolvens]SFJ79454.1 molecular chaperone Hsp33 [Succinivibrio dextrinosolvens]